MKSMTPGGGFVGGALAVVWLARRGYGDGGAGWA